MSKWALFAAVATLETAAAVAAANDGPSREQIAAAFNLHAGTQVSVDVGGTHYEAHYVRVEARREGEYALVFRLRK